MWRSRARVRIGKAMNRDLISLASAISTARVLCVGDIMLDRFVNGEVTRISPEAPVPILRVKNERMMLGGVGNVARNVAALGGQVTLVTLTGQDAAGDEINTALTNLISVKAELVRDTSRQTAVKTRFIANTQQILRTDEEIFSSISDEVGEELLLKAEAAMSQNQVVILSDYGKGVLGEGRAQRLIASAKSAGIAVIVDPKGSNYGIYSGADVVTPNRKELCEATGMPVVSFDQVAGAARTICRNHDVKAVLITLSQDGMILVRAEEIHHLQAKTREVFDVSGAGDTVVATIAGAVATGAELEDAARLANVCAGIVVAKAGTAAAYLPEVISALQLQGTLHDKSKLVDQEQAHDKVEVWRRQGLKVGFTNGCFDLLHPGHVSLLRQARNSCDRLVVGLNSDSSVKTLKGLSRPVQSETARATVLESLSTVDLCILFDEDTPIDLISRLKPDVLVKGDDYTLETVVGALEVKSWGGEVVLAKLEKGFSTSATIDRMKKNTNIN